MKNQLEHETSPYLLQHMENPVHWYPWCDEAFAKAQEEDKPIFLSIGYSTCHWCHVMAHESFEDKGIAGLLNRFFVSIKVDKEERPDIDSVYMSVCQTFTGSGGWPTSIFMTPDKKPFYAGTYFPKTSRYGSIGFAELLLALHEKWETSRDMLLHSAESILAHLEESASESGTIDPAILSAAYDQYEQSFDETCGGFGVAPKFPAPHNLLFLMDSFEKRKEPKALEMAEKTLLQMYRGGLFDHIGYGFSRYATDRAYLIPHFEKMLYDNALLIAAYSKAYAVTKNRLYLDVAEKTAAYIFREMTTSEGGFYCAQDADSDGVEGKYYVFTPHEMIHVLGQETGQAFCEHYGITPSGNFEGKSIPNLLEHNKMDDPFSSHLPALYQYRKKRAKLHLDDKILTSWNSMMICALALLYRVSGEKKYLDAAKKAASFLETSLCKDGELLVSFRNGDARGAAFLDDYAYYTLALLSLYKATFEDAYLERAKKFCDEGVRRFLDSENGGFYLYGKGNETLILRPKETYDGAIPSGNSVMAYNFVLLAQLTEDEKYEALATQQLSFLAGAAQHYPSGHSFFLLALSRYLEPPEHIVLVLGEGEVAEAIVRTLPLEAALCVLSEPSAEYPLLDGKTTFYVCKNKACQPPTNHYR